MAVGPRSAEEQFTGQQLAALLGKVGDTLTCKKYLSPVPEQMLVRCSVLLACKLACGGLPVVSGPEGGPQPDPSPVQGLLEALVELWSRACCPAPPLHLLFTQLSLAHTLAAGKREWNDFLFLVAQLVEKGLLGEEVLMSHWRTLSTIPWPTGFMEKIQQLFHTSSSSSPSLPGLQSHMDVLQVSTQPLEGAN